MKVRGTSNSSLRHAREMVAVDRSGSTSTAVRRKRVPYGAAGRVRFDISTVPANGAQYAHPELLFTLKSDLRTDVSAARHEESSKIFWFGIGGLDIPVSTYYVDREGLTIISPSYWANSGDASLS